jgi:hypothetical protein
MIILLAQTCAAVGALVCIVITRLLQIRVLVVGVVIRVVILEVMGILVNHPT